MYRVAVTELLDGRGLKDSQTATYRLGSSQRRTSMEQIEQRFRKQPALN